MLPRKFFENLHTVLAILALFEQFSGKVCSYFWPQTLSASLNMMHFARTVSIIRAKGVQELLLRRGLKLWKNFSHSKHC